VTRSYSAPTIEAPDLEAAVRAMREHGLRVSAARRLVLEAIFAAGEPVTAERIADGLGGRLPRSDITSVYRSLERLEEIGLARHFHLGHGPGLYVRAGAPVREFLLCDACGQVRPVDPGELDRVRAVIREDLGHEASFTHFPIAGLCRDCARGR
jgi:Fur family ferric uptake transcriptional regulator